MSRDDGYWFPAKTLGFGWGPPRRWQGWLVLAVYMAAMIGIGVRFPPNAHPAAFFFGGAVATALLIAVCALKGEPPRWRWKR